MEYQEIGPDLHSKEIKPADLINEYANKLKYDINTIFNKDEFNLPGCPVDGDHLISGSFTKFGMQYFISSKYNSIYLSPRPGKKQLIDFYCRSGARKYWLQELWKITSVKRKQKIIRPNFEWIKSIMKDIFQKKDIAVAEYFANQWGYWECSSEYIPESHYYLINPLFNPEWHENGEIQKSIIPSDKISDRYDAICLFEAMNRSENPTEMLGWTWEHLKPGGYCFITVILSTGFEIQMLGERSNSIIPPEGMNLFSYEGMKKIIENQGKFETVEFSTPGVLDFENVIRESGTGNITLPGFIQYMVNHRNDNDSIKLFQDFLKTNKLSSIGRVALRKI